MGYKKWVLSADAAGSYVPLRMLLHALCFQLSKLLWWSDVQKLWGLRLQKDSQWIQNVNTTAALQPGKFSKIFPQAGDIAVRLEVDECETDAIIVALLLAVLVFLPGKDKGRRSARLAPPGSVAGGSLEGGLAALSVARWHSGRKRDGRHQHLTVASEQIFAFKILS